MSDLTFDVTGWSPNPGTDPDGGEGVATGTISGIKFTYEGNLLKAGMTEDGTFIGFNDPSCHSPPLPSSDRMHIWNHGILTLEREIDGLLIYLKLHPDNLTPIHLIACGTRDEITGEFIAGNPVVVSGYVNMHGKYFGTPNEAGGLVHVTFPRTKTLYFEGDPHTDGCIDVAFIARPKSLSLF